MTREFQVYSGAAPQSAQVSGKQVPLFAGVPQEGAAVDAAIGEVQELGVRLARLHDLGVQQRVTQERERIRTEMDVEMQQAAEAAWGSSESLFRADGSVNSDRYDGIVAKYWGECDGIQTGEFALRENAVRYEGERESERNDIALRMMRFTALKSLENTRKAFADNLKLAVGREDWAAARGLVEDARGSLLNDAEAELELLRLSERRMRGLGRAARGGSRKAVSVGGRPYHGVSAALAMQAARDGWKPSGEEVAVAEAAEPDAGGAAESGALTLGKAGEFHLSEGKEVVGYRPDISSRFVSEKDAPALPEGLGMTLAGGDDPLSVDDAARVPLDAMRALQDDFSDTLRIGQELGADGRMHFEAEQNAPLIVRAAAAQAEVRGAIEPEAARGVVGEITLDTVRHNPEATVAQIMEQFDSAGIYEALGEGDAEVGKQRTQAIVQEWHARGTTGYTNVSAKNVERMVEAAVNAPEFGRGQEWRKMERLNPNVSGGYDKPDRKDAPEARKRWDALFAVYKRHREEFSVERGKEMQPLTKYGDVDKDEFEPVAQEFYRWYMGKKHDAMKRDAMAAGRAYYTAAVSEELAKHVAVGADGRPVAQFSNEIGIVKGVLAKPVPDMGVEEAAVQAEERERLNEQLLAASRARAQESYRKLAEFKQEHAKHGKEAERRKRAEERAAEKAEKDAEKREETRRQQELYKRRITPRTAQWEWSSEDSAPGMPPTCTVPREEYGRLMDELGMEDEHVPYMVCNGKKVMVVGYHQGGKVRLNGPAVQAVYGRPKKGQSWPLQGELGYHYEFKKSK